jgi:hypothetical protein
MVRTEATTRVLSSGAAKVGVCMQHNGLWVKAEARARAWRCVCWGPRTSAGMQATKAAKVGGRTNNGIRNKGEGDLQDTRHGVRKIVHMSWQGHGPTGGNAGMQGRHSSSGGTGACTMHTCRIPLRGVQRRVHI